MAMIDGPRLAPSSGKAATSLVVLVHGFGAEGDSMMKLVPYWQGGLPDTAWAAPTAPLPAPTFASGKQWWSMVSAGPQTMEGAVSGAAPVLNEFIDAELKRLGLGEDRLALVGFSFGGTLALHVGPRRKARIAGIVSYSGMVADEPFSLRDAPYRPPVLLAHGEMDEDMPVELHHASKAGLETFGFAVEEYVAPGLEHRVDEKGLALGAAFLKRVLG